MLIAIKKTLSLGRSACWLRKIINMVQCNTVLIYEIPTLGALLACAIYTNTTTASFRPCAKSARFVYPGVYCLFWFMYNTK